MQQDEAVSSPAGWVSQGLLSQVTRLIAGNQSVIRSEAENYRVHFISRVGGKYKMMMWQSCKRATTPNWLSASKQVWVCNR
jgi:hypothetical protein